MLILVAFCLAARTASGTIRNKAIVGFCNEPETDPHAIDAHNAASVMLHLSGSLPGDGNMFRVVPEVTRWTSERMNAYVAHLIASRLSMSTELFGYLIQINQMDIEAEVYDVNAVWDAFRSVFPSTRDSCRAMQVWYAIGINALAMKDISSLQYQTIDGKVCLNPDRMLLQLAMTADVAYTPQPVNPSYTYTFAQGYAAYRRAPSRHHGDHYIAPAEYPFTVAHRIWSMVVMPTPASRVPLWLSEPPHFEAGGRSYRVLRKILRQVNAGYFETVPITLANVKPLFPDALLATGKDYRSVRKVTKALLDIISVRVEVLEDFLNMSTWAQFVSRSHPETQSLPQIARWYQKVILPFVGHSVGDIGIAVIPVGNGYNVFPRPELVAELLKENYPEEFVTSGIDFLAMATAEEYQSMSTYE
jgi:hypothetical protein